jgi:hypothetical protein
MKYKRRIVEQFIESGKIRVTPSLFHQDELRKRIVMTLNMNRVVQHIADAMNKNKGPTQAGSAQQVRHKWVLFAYYAASGAQRPAS